LNNGKMIILTLLVLMILCSFTSCGKKTPLFFKDRAESYRIK
jgi:predicted small lipoprotein YifL